MLKNVLRKGAVVVVATGTLVASLAGTANAAPPSTCTTPFGQQVPAEICKEFTFDTSSHKFDRSDAIALCVLSGLAFPPSTLISGALFGYQCIDSIIDPGPTTREKAAKDCIAAFIADTKGGIKAKMILGNGITCTLNFQNTNDDGSRGDFVTIYA